MYDTWQWTFGTLFYLLIFNHIDHVSHYFHRIWPLHADDMHSILTLNYYLSFETGFSRFAIANVVRILIACRAMCTSSIMHTNFALYQCMPAAAQFGCTPMPAPRTLALR